MTTRKPIRVTFDRKALQDIDHDVHINNKVIKGLKDAGIPVVGGIWIRGVSSGRLEMFNEGSNAVYQWTPGDDEDDEL